MYWITGLLGITLALTPFIFGYQNNTVAMWVSLLLGGGVVGLSFLEGMARDKDNWEYWVTALVGVAAIASPFVFQYGDNLSAFWTSISAGILMIVVAASKLYYGNMLYK